jgi:ubiquinone/menaquinone biosynthesis C-methylase UbiE
VVQQAAAVAAPDQEGAGCVGHDPVLAVQVGAVGAQPPQRALDVGAGAGHIVRSLDRHLRQEVVRDDRCTGADVPWPG